MRGWFLSALVGLFLQLPWVLWAQVPASGMVERVIDGDTFVLQGGARVRLLDINAPELAHNGETAQPYGEIAKQGLKAMIEGKQVTLEVGDTPYDRYQRILAHVYTATGGWVNGGMVRAGLAHVYTFPDNAMYAPQLSQLEDEARTGHKGIWSLNRWRPRNAATCCGATDMGQFILVEGTVREAVSTVDRHENRIIYLNFGPDYRTDFTIAIRGSHFASFYEAGIADIATYYRGKHLRVRGYAEPINGTMIHVTHPAQIQVL